MATTKESARRKAEALVKKLKGSGWKPQVWNNIGWHYKVVSGPVQVYPMTTPSTDHDDEKFWCMIGSDAKGSPGGAGWWTPQRCRYFKDPNRAVKDALSYVYPFVEKINEVVKAAEKAAGVKR